MRQATGGSSRVRTISVLMGAGALVFMAAALQVNAAPEGVGQANRLPILVAQTESPPPAPPLESTAPPTTKGKGQGKADGAQDLEKPQPQAKKVKKTKSKKAKKAYGGQTIRSRERPPASP